MVSAYRRRHRTARRRRSSRRTRRQRRHVGGVAYLPITTWGAWANHPGALAWSATTTAPPPLANGGLYTMNQSTGEWASRPFPATLAALELESARLSPDAHPLHINRTL